MELMVKEGNTMSLEELLSKKKQLIDKTVQVRGRLCDIGKARCANSLNLLNRNYYPRITITDDNGINLDCYFNRYVEVSGNYLNKIITVNGVFVEENFSDRIIAWTLGYPFMQPRSRTHIMAEDFDYD